jgi:hypothetical protein
VMIPLVVVVMLIFSARNQKVSPKGELILK